MKQSEISHVLKKHAEWMARQDGGQAANLTGANLRGADLCGANLRGADLCGANLRGADLCDANLRDAKIDSLQAARLTVVPDGELIVYKKLDDGSICTLRVPSDSPRSNATSRKCRCKFAYVVKGGGVSKYDPGFRYYEGQRVECDYWEEDRWIECGGGIHFFLTKEEAESY